MSGSDVVEPGAHLGTTHPYLAVMLMLDGFEFGFADDFAVSGQVMGKAGSHPEPSSRGKHKRSYNTQGWKWVVLKVDFERSINQPLKEPVIPRIDSTPSPRFGPQVYRDCLQI